MLSDSNDPGRWHPLSWELVEVGGVWVCVNPKITHAIVHEALAKGALEGFQGYTIESHRGAGKNQGIDFILLGAENNCFISLQIVTHTEGGTAWFPDAPSEPARNVLRRLVEVVEQGHRAVAFFHVLRNDCDQLKLAAEIDRSYARALNEARKAGVELLAYRADVTSEDVSLGVPIPFSL
jgi:sugar fermentation stimulation protein A